MPGITLRLDPKQHAELARRAKLAGTSLSGYVLKAALADDVALLVRELHAHVLGSTAAGLGKEGAAAVEVLAGLGLTNGTARKRVEAILADRPQATAEQIIRDALRKEQT